jgi:hypothetical protein
MSHMIGQLQKQANGVIAAPWLNGVIKPSQVITFNFRNGGVTDQDATPDMKTALKVFTTAYFDTRFSGRLSFCQLSSKSGDIKIVGTPKDGNEIVLNLSFETPHSVYDRDGYEIYPREDKAV